MAGYGRRQATNEAESRNQNRERQWPITGNLDVGAGNLATASGTYGPGVMCRRNRIL
jgi:hypothetical protein